jgi:catechol 2,3-dioxygenase-like lactoylglutathione lyase family enzyme
MTSEFVPGFDATVFGSQAGRSARPVGRAYAGALLSEMEVVMIGKFPIYPNLAAADLERAKRWYADKLDLSPALDLGVGGLLYVSGGSPFAIYQTEAAGTAQNTVAGWVVDDFDQLIKDLRARGVTFEEYAMGDKGPTTVNGVATDPSGGRAAWFKDSEGNVLAITQLPPGMTMPGREGS